MSRLQSVRNPERGRPVAHATFAALMESALASGSIALAAIELESAESGRPIDDLRKAVVAHVGAEEQPLQTLRRISVGNVVVMALLVVVAYTVIGAIQSVGLSAIVDAIADISNALGGR